MKSPFKKILLAITVTVAVGLLYALYLFRFASERTQYVNDATGMVIFGYDGRRGKWLMNEMPRYELGVDGPHILYDKNVVIYTMQGKDSCYLVREALTAQDSFLCTVDKVDLNTFYFRLKQQLTNPASSYPMPEKLIAISDIEGSFQSLAKLLIGNKVVDKDLRWIWGNGHLVLNGDFVDRGTNVTQCLWLIYKLEAEAEKAGGKVHYILGNHEQLNLRGNVKYVEPKYKELAMRLGIPYKEIYGINTELGRWLRTKNAIEQIGDLVFAHGGVSPEVAELQLPIDSMNKICKANLDMPRAELTNTTRLLLADSGILWYRGLVKEHPNEDLSQQAVDEIAKRMGVKTIVVGHTIVSNVSADYNGRVIRTDVKHSEAEPQALLIKNGVFYRTNTKGNLTKL